MDKLKVKLLELEIAGDFFFFKFQFKEQCSRYIRYKGQIWVDSREFNLI